MSFEGYYQLWCKNGHISYMDVYDVKRNHTCPECGVQQFYVNLVDETNGESEGFIEEEVLVPAATEKCNLGMDHIIIAATYVIPEGLRLEDFSKA